MESAFATLSAQTKTPERIALLNRLNAEYISLKGMFSDEFYKIQEGINTVCQVSYLDVRRLDENGQPRPLSDVERYNQFYQAVFQDFIKNNKTGYEQADMWIDNAINAAGVVVEGIGVARGFNFNRTYERVHDGRQFKAGQKAAREYYQNKGLIP